MGDNFFLGGYTCRVIIYGRVRPGFSVTCDLGSVVYLSHYRV